MASQPLGLVVSGINTWLIHGSAIKRHSYNQLLGTGETIGPYYSQSPDGCDKDPWACHRYGGSCLPDGKNSFRNGTNEALRQG